MTSKKENVSLGVINSMVKILFFHFRVINSNLKSIKLHFELLTKFRLKLKIQFYLCPVPLEGHRKELVCFFGHPLKLIYLCIIISYYSQPLFSKFNLLSTRNLGLKIKFSIFVCKKHWLSNKLMVSLLN